MTDNSASIETATNRPTINLNVDFGISKVLSLLTLAWWFAGIAIAPWFWWKLAACIPPVGMIIAVDRALTVYAPQVMTPVVATPKPQSPFTAK